MENENKKDFHNLKNELKNSIKQKPQISISYNDDNTESYLTIIPKTNNIDLKKEYIDHIIKTNNISYGIIKNLSDKIIENFFNNKPIKSKKYIIAKGKQPTDTKPKSINPLSQNKELVMIGEIIGEIIPETKGEFGIDVKGNRIAPKLDKTTHLDIGENMNFVEQDNKTLVQASITGVLFIDNDNHKMNILPEEDGKFKIFIDNKTGEILLSVYPPIGRKKPVDTSEVYDKITELKITKIINPESIEIAVKAGANEEVIDYRIGKGRPENYRIKITISDDNMKAFIDIDRPIIPNHTLTEKEILKEIQKSKIIKGYTSESIIDIVKIVNEYRESIINKKIAEGEPPIDEEKDFIDYRVEFIAKDIEFTIKDESGNDIRKKGDVATIEHPNELICILVKGTVRGQEGYTVTGEKLNPERNIAIDLKAGRNVFKRNEEPEKIAFYSQIKGNIYFYDNQIHILDN